MDAVSTATAPGLIDDRIRALDEAMFVIEFVDKSDARRQLYVPVWDEVLSNYLVNPFTMGSGRMMTHTRQGTVVPAWQYMAGRRTQSILKDPETHQIVESIASQGVSLLLGQRDNILATPVGADDPEKARLIARLLMSAMSAPGVWRTHYQLIKDAFLFGTAILEIGWETRSRRQFVPSGSDLVPDDVLYRDRPMQRVVDIYDFYPDPSGTRIQEDMIGVAKRFRITAQEAMRLGRAGIYDLDDVRSAIGRALDQRRPKDKVGTPRRRFEGEPQELPDKFMPLDGFEYWGESPVPTPDRISNRVITLLNGVRVRSRGNPFLDGNIPFKEVVVNPIGGRFYGLSPAEVVRFLQDSTDGLLMAYTDLVAQAVKGPILVGNSWGGNPQELREQQGFINCADPDKVKRMPFEVNVLQMAAAEITRRKMSMREAGGDTNPMERITADRQAATTTSEIVRLAAQRAEPMIQLIERDDYPWIGRTLHSRFRQFMPAGGAIASLAGESFPVPLEAIDMDADIRFIGARQGGSRFQQFTQLRMAGELIGSDMGRRLLMVAPEIMIRILRDGLEMADAEEVVKNAQAREIALMQVEAAREAAGAGQTRGQAPSPRPSREEQSGTPAGQMELQGQAVA